MKAYHYLYLTCAAALMAGTSYAQTPAGNDAVLNRVAAQLKAFPQEKVYVHIDKGTYLQGDTLWFRAYPVDATFHTLLKDRRLVYVELVAPTDTVVSQALIRPQEGGIYQGYLPIGSDRPEGIYTLRAYTRYMAQNEAVCIYNRPVQVVHPDWNDVRIKAREQSSGKKGSMQLHFLKNWKPMELTGMEASASRKDELRFKPLNDGRYDLQIDWDEALRKKQSSWLLTLTDKDNRNYRRYMPLGTTHEDFDVTFYPEGGYLLAGAPCRVAFKALGSSGHARNIRLEVQDPSGQPVAVGQSLHEGMGLFSFVPQAGQEYKVVCFTDNEEQKTFSLGKADTKAQYGLRVDAQKDNFKVTVLVAPGAASQPLQLVAHVRGVVFYTAPCKEANQSLLFAKGDIPAGVVQFLLLDQNGNVLSERLAFSGNQPDAICKVDLAGFSAQPRAHTNIGVTLTDAAQKPLKGSYSLAVTDASYVPADSCQSILTYLLLTSELKGTIADPGFYFAGTSASRLSLDLLMMTQGWRRYDLPSVLRGNLSQPLLQKHTDMALLGQTIARSGVLQKKDNQHLVTVRGVGRSRGFQRIIPTGADGSFCIDSIEYANGSGFTVEAVQLKGRNTANVELQPQPVKLPAALFPQSPLADDSLEVVRPAELGGITKVANLHYLLRDVVVTAPFWGTTDYRKLNDGQTSEYKDMRTLLKGLGMTIHPESAVDTTSITDAEGNHIAQDNSRTYDRLYYGKQRVVVFIDDALCRETDNVVNWLTPGDIESAVFLKDVKRARVNELLVGIDGWEKSEYNSYDLVHDFVDASSREATLPVLNITTKSGFDSRCFGWWSAVYDKAMTRSRNRFTFYPLGYQLPAEFYSPKYDTKEKKDSKAPDLRTTLFWQPRLEVDGTGRASFSFYNSDQTKDYLMVIEGVSDNGQPVHIVQPIKK